MIDPLEVGTPPFACDASAAKFVIETLRRDPAFVVQESGADPYAEISVDGVRYYCYDSCIVYLRSAGEFSWSDARFARLREGLQIARVVKLPAVGLAPDPSTTQSAR